MQNIAYEDWLEREVASMKRNSPLYEKLNKLYHRYMLVINKKHIQFEKRAKKMQPMFKGGKSPLDYELLIPAGKTAVPMSYYTKLKVFLGRHNVYLD